MLLYCRTLIPARRLAVALEGSSPAIDPLINCFQDGRVFALETSGRKKSFYIPYDNKYYGALQRAASSQFFPRSPMRGTSAAVR